MKKNCMVIVIALVMFSSCVKNTENDSGFSSFTENNSDFSTFSETDFHTTESASTILDDPESSEASAENQPPPVPAPEYIAFSDENELMGVKYKGEVVVPAAYDSIQLVCDNQYAIAALVDVDENGEKKSFPEAKWGCISIRENPGQVTVPFIYWRLYPGEKSLGAELRSDADAATSSAGIIDYHNQPITPFRYYTVSGASNGIYVVSQNNLSGYVAEDGNEIFEPQFDKAELFYEENDYAIAFKHYKGLSKKRELIGSNMQIEVYLYQYVVIDKEGTIVYECPYILKTDKREPLLEDIKIRDGKYPILDTTKLDSTSSVDLDINGYYGTWGVREANWYREGWDWVPWGEYKDILSQVIDWTDSCSFLYSD